MSEFGYKYLESIEKRGSVPGLEAISAMLDRLESPQSSFKAVHVTGTNGKGSFCSLMASVLRESGYRVGVFSSPHLTDIREMITVDGEMISKSRLEQLVIKLAPISESLKTPLTQFEFMTALCFEYFRQEGVEIGIIEVGMGGRLDATNVFTSPLLSVITGISLDHTSFLGAKLDEIAKEKSGIIKKDCPVYYGGGDGSFEAIIKESAEELGSPYYRRGKGEIKLLATDLDGSVFEYEGGEYSLSIAGEYQVNNAAAVIDCCRILNQNGFDLSADVINRGIKKVKRRARFEVISKDPPVIYDGGHNPECAKALVNSVKTYFKGEKVEVIMGVLGDKDYTEMAAIISEIASRVYTVTPNNKRALDSKTLASVFCRLGVESVDCQSYQNALALWREGGEKPLIVTGSLYSYKDFTDCFKK